MKKPELSLICLSTPVTVFNPFSGRCCTFLFSYLSIYLINTKSRKRKGKLLLKNEEIFRRMAHTSAQNLTKIFWRSQMSFSIRREAHTNIWKPNWNILMITDVFLEQKRVLKITSVKFLCVCVSLLSGDLFIFLFLFFCVIRISVFLSMWSHLIKLF